MEKILSRSIEEAVYTLCVNANTQYDCHLYDLILQRYNSADSEQAQTKYSKILKNIKLAQDMKRPLCQDTGQVIVFAALGSDVIIEGDTLPAAINKAVLRAYKENFYRKSIVKNALFNRENTNTNTPVIIYTEIVEGASLELNLTVKGAGAENYSDVKMFRPASCKEDIFEFIKNTAAAAGEKSCPPMALGIGIGGTMDYAAQLSKKAFFHIPDEDENLFINDLKKYLSSSSLSDLILDIRIASSQTHIASLPVAVTINCHSSRHASCVLDGRKIRYKTNLCEYIEIDSQKTEFKEINVSDISAIRALKQGEQILLTGEIYTARDAAHKLIKEYFEANKKLPFDFENKIIFYAGPCPSAPGEIIGPIGPTTSARMDCFCEFMHSKGLLASIGKGERSIEAQQAIKKYNGRYFSAQGGVACLMAKCVKKAEFVCFEQLGTEAVRKLYVKKLPVKVEF